MPLTLERWSELRRKEHCRCWACLGKSEIGTASTAMFLKRVVETGTEGAEFGVTRAFRPFEYRGPVD